MAHVNHQCFKMYLPEGAQTVISEIIGDDDNDQCVFSGESLKAKPWHSSPKRGDTCETLVQDNQPGTAMGLKRQDRRRKVIKRHKRAIIGDNESLDSGYDGHISPPKTNPTLYCYCFPEKGITLVTEGSDYDSVCEDNLSVTLTEDGSDCSLDSNDTVKLDICLAADVTDLNETFTDKTIKDAVENAATYSDAVGADVHLTSEEIGGVDNVQRTKVNERRHEDKTSPPITPLYGALTSVGQRSGFISYSKSDSDLMRHLHQSHLHEEHGTETAATTDSQKSVFNTANETTETSGVHNDHTSGRNKKNARTKKSAKEQEVIVSTKFHKYTIDDILDHYCELQRAADEVDYQLTRGSHETCRANIAKVSQKSVATEEEVVVTIEHGENENVAFQRSRMRKSIRNSLNNLVSIPQKLNGNVTRSKARQPAKIASRVCVSAQQTFQEIFC